MAEKFPTKKYEPHDKMMSRDYILALHGADFWTDKRDHPKLNRAP